MDAWIQVQACACNIMSVWGYEENDEYSWNLASMETDAISMKTKHREEKHQKQTQLTPTLSTPATLHTKKAVPPNWTVVLCAIICK